ncbi:uncharacterized protein LOC141631086 [Silene latifolia]|uniref:uncharacterized protein LOC141631086 n=1 Tax=Silene latifolia TaxID=37657 RepID=UPI003D7739EB
MTTVASSSSRTSHLGLPYFCGVDSVGRSGGLPLRWDDSVVLTTLCLDSHYILCKLAFTRPPCKNYVMFVIFIYGEGRFEYQQSMWNRITSLISGITPLLLIGDFNQVELFSDKLQGTSSIRGQRDFTTCKIANGLADLPFFGPRFTWMNSQLNTNIIMERLDRAYANQDLFHLFPSASVTHLPILVSDHAPIILTLFPVSTLRRRPYRIDNWCLSFPEVQKLVTTAWDTPFYGSSIFVLSEVDLDLTASQIVDDQSATTFLQLRSSRLQLLRTQRQYWVQRSKLTSEVLDGFPTHFLYNRVKQRATKHHILALCSANGNWLHSSDSITSEILTYFKNLLRRDTTQDSAAPLGFIHPLLSGLNLPKLGPVECSMLQAPFSEQDILHALPGMDGSKSPGPDGITPIFFHIFLPQIGHLVTLAILRFLNSGVMLKEWNNTLIVLIPKVDKPELISQYRPISLCNVVYCLASKCLANRLKLVIPSLISDSQQAFVPDRLMSDGFLIAHEIMHYLNKAKKGTNCYSVLKLDMHKAFDRVSWHFLMSVFERFGFHTTWGNLIWEYDAFICCKATPSSFEVLRDIFRSFEASSQMINLDKSFIKLSPNSPDDFKSHMTSILRMKDSSTFGTYLGVPVDLPKQKTTIFHGLIDKLTTRISSWSSLHLSQSSKLVIINSILLGSMAHILAAVPLPLAISRKLDSLIAAFWWSKDTSRRSIHWLSQQHLHALRDNGGLGIKSVMILGQVTLMKNFWRLHYKPNGLLAKYLTPKYRKDLPIPGLKSKVTQPSYVWKGVCRVVASCALALVWKVGNGASFDLLSSPWVQGQAPVWRRPHPPLVPTISELVLDNGSWNPRITFNLFAQFTAKDILAMEPPVLDSDDFLYWKYTEDGSYNVRSGNSFKSCYTASFSDSISGLTECFYVRATSAFTAYSQALLQFMMRPRSDPSASITFWQIPKEISSTARQIPFQRKDEFETRDLAVGIESHASANE